MTAGAHLGVAVLVVIGVLYLAAQLRRHGLHAVTDTEYRYSQLEYHLGGTRCLGGGGAFRTAGENHPIGIEGADIGLFHVVGVQLAVDSGLAHAAGDKLGVLGTEIEDQDTLGVDISGHALVSITVKKE